MEIIESILLVLQEWGRIVPRPFESKYGWHRRMKGINKTQFERGLRHMQGRGLVKVISKNGQRFIELTKSGELQALLSKAKRTGKQKWDGKWRLIMFDIPEEAKDKREFFRKLLKSNGFYKLQASVYINPYPINSSAIAYLKETQLMAYIRVLRVDKMDKDLDLKKHFNLIA